MKGIVLAGGKGSRLRPFTYSGAKQLVPIANTPVLHFPIRQLAEAGVTEIAIVVGETEAQIREAMGDGSAFGVSFTYIRQPEPLGIAHAVALCQPFVGGDRFVLYLGDNVLEGGITSFVDQFRSSNAVASVILRSVPDPRAFGVAEVAGERLLRVIEKPAHPPTDLAVIGVYAFAPEVFDVIAGQRPSPRGELEIADSINGLLERGRPVSAAVTTSYWIDTGKMEDMLAANRVILDALPASSTEGATFVETMLSGVVVLEPGATLERCTVTGPVVVGAGARLTGCTVGPHVAIGAGSVLSNVTIANSIVMESSTLTDCPGITASMIGRYCTVSRAAAGSRLTLGDHSSVEAQA